MFKKTITGLLLTILIFWVSLVVFSCSKKVESKKENNVEQAPKVYEGVIDIKSLDVNKDGKVYQCPMDYNVLGDKPGNCPECNMDLEEVSIAEAESNLVKSDFEVKK